MRCNRPARRVAVAVLLAVLASTAALAGFGPAQGVVTEARVLALIAANAPTLDAVLNTGSTSTHTLTTGAHTIGSGSGLDQTNVGSSVQGKVSCSSEINCGGGVYTNNGIFSHLAYTLTGARITDVSSVGFFVNGAMANPSAGDLCVAALTTGTIIRNGLRCAQDLNGDGSAYFEGTADAYNLHARHNLQAGDGSVTAIQAIGPVQHYCPTSVNAYTILKSAGEVVATTSGNTVSTTNLWPAGVIRRGVVIHVNSAVTTTGADTFDIGDGIVGAAAYGNDISGADNTTTTNTSWTVNPITDWSASAGGVTLTAPTLETFQTGSVSVVVFWEEASGPDGDQ